MSFFKSSKFGDAKSNSIFSRNNLSNICIVFFLFIFVILLLLLTLYLFKKISIDQAILLPLLPASAVATSGIIAFLVFQHNRINSEEPWLVYFRDSYKEFWENESLSKSRKLICQDRFYFSVLVPALNACHSEDITDDQYSIIENIDIFCALMVRVVYVDMGPMTDEQQVLWTCLGYQYWLYRIKLRPELSKYIKDNWINLYPYIENASTPEEQAEAFLKLAKGKFSKQAYENFAYHLRATKE